MRKVIMLLTAAALITLSSCNLSQTILKGGCVVHEFGTVYGTTDSTGVYIVCDNTKLAKNYPKLAGQALKVSSAKLQQAPLK